jgi:hypothetical protein
MYGVESHLMGEQVSPERTLASLRFAKRDLTLSLAARGCRTGPLASCRDMGELALGGVRRHASRARWL